MTLFFNIFYFPQTNRMLLGHYCMYFCLYLFLRNIIIIEKKKKALTKLSKTLFPIKSSSVSCAFLVFYFEVVFSASVVDLLMQ